MGPLHGMHAKSTLMGATAVAAAMLLAGVSPALGQTGKRPLNGHQSARPARLKALDASAARASRFAATHSALGSYFDKGRNEQVVVVPRGSHVTGAEVSRAVGAHSRVVERSISKATVDSIQHRIARRAFSPAAKHYNYASYLNLATGKVELDTTAPAAVTAPLLKSFPGRIDKHTERVRDDYSRQADIPAFWGGASISDGSFICSAGFTVQNGSGTRFMATAGHCFGLGTSVFTTGGGLSLGSVAQRGPIPPFDMELIGGGSYGSYIYVGGTNSSAGKHVVGAGDPVVGYNNYCRSGQTTGEQCGETVNSVNAQVCTQTGCKSPVIAYSGPASAGGDSGAPFYVYSVDGSVVYIRGLHIAAGGNTMYAEKWSRISSHLGVSIVS